MLCVLEGFSVLFCFFMSVAKIFKGFSPIKCDFLKPRWIHRLLFSGGCKANSSQKEYTFDFRLKSRHFFLKKKYMLALLSSLCNLKFLSNDCLFICRVINSQISKDIELLPAQALVLGHLWISLVECSMPGPKCLLKKIIAGLAVGNCSVLRN